MPGMDLRDESDLFSPESTAPKVKIPALTVQTNDTMEAPIVQTNDTTEAFDQWNNLT